MKRVLLPALPPVGTVVSPPEAERRHLQDVRRVKIGEEIEVLDGSGGLARARVVDASRTELRLEIIAHLDAVRDSPLHLELLLALPVQRGTLDAMLPGLVQLGADTLYVVHTEFGGRLKKEGDKYLKRLDTIVTQSLKQCGRTRVPRVVLETRLADVVARMAADNPLNILFHPVPEQPALPETADRLGLLIGPEGGFSDGEVALAREHGMAVRGLGPRILKMETAATGVAFWAQCRYGDV